MGIFKGVRDDAFIVQGAPEGRPYTQNGYLSSHRKKMAPEMETLACLHNSAKLAKQNGAGEGSRTPF